MLLGRQRQTRQIEQLLRAARASEGGALVIRGETGVGKTALLRHAEVAAAAQKMRVLWVAGIESESELAFSSLATVLHPLIENLQKLPPRQRAALEAALLLGPSVEADRFAVYVGTLTLLSAAAEAAPLAVLVDDAQWLDRASLETLLFAARRLRGTPIAHLFTVRAGVAFPSTEGLPEELLDGLDAEAGHTLLSQTAKGSVAPIVAARLHRETAGNPLALTELAATLDPKELDGRRPLPEPLPITVHLELGFGARISDLSHFARRALILAAACGECDVGPIARALTSLGLPADALTEAEAAGLLVIRDGTIAFRHPLVRSAAYRHANEDERRASHRAIADALDAPADRERRAWHLGASTAGADAAIADELETTSQRALTRGSHPAAAAALEKSARITPDAKSRARRLVAAAGLWERAGLGVRALALADEVEDADDSQLEAERHHIQGRVLMWTGDPTRAREILASGADRVENAAPAQAAAMLVDASIASTMTGDCAAALRLARRATALGARVGGMAMLGPQFSLAHALILNGLTREGVQLGREVVARARELTSHLACPILTSIPIVLHFGEDHETAREVITEAVDTAREQGLLALLPYALASLSLIESRLGRMRRALAAATEATQFARDLGLRSELAFACYCAAVAEGGLGMEAESREHARDALQLAQELGIDSLVTMTCTAIGVLEVSLQRPDAAVGPLETARSLLRHQNMRQPIVAPWNAEYIEALVLLGRRPEAALALAEFADIVESADSAWGRAVLARCRAMLAPEGYAVVAFEEAIALHEGGPIPLDRARTRLRFGQLLHRQRRTLEARRQLRAALSEFELLEARAWIDQSKAALAATGERVGDAAKPHLALLTPQETQVCLAVANGATNREVAARFFLSTKTVETHLTSAYRKLAVRSRSELAGLLARIELRERA